MTSKFKVGFTNLSDRSFTREKAAIVKTLRKNQYISVADVNNLADTNRYSTDTNVYANPYTDSGQSTNKTRKIESFDESGRFSQEVIAKITRQLLWVPRVYRAYYIATLNAMSEVLDDPKQEAVSVEEGLRTVQAKRYVLLKLNKLPTEHGLLNHTQNVVLTSGAPKSEAPWRRLSDITMGKKNLMGKSALQFWRHTGLLSRTFKTYKNEQVRRATLKQFKSTARVTLKYSADEAYAQAVKVNGKRCFAANIQYSVSVPRWTNTLDQIMTDPFMGDLSSFAETRKGLRAAVARVVRNKENKHVLTPTSAIQKIAAVEATRPWLRKLAYLSGKNMRNYLKTISK